ncbi:MAG: HlyD family efflux transporter periplasmic adaptor subunit [Lachnospiraceae bacterium]
MARRERENKVISIKKHRNINLGMIFYGVIFIYIIGCIFLYFQSSSIAPYQVKTGSLSVNNTYRGIALREELIVNSKFSGYINYYAREGERIGANKTVCTIDESGRLKELIEAENLGENSLSANDLNEVKVEVVNYITNFNEKFFSTTYDFKYSMEGTVLKLANSSILLNMDQLIESGDSGFINLSTTPESGIIVYSYDGFEGRSSSSLTAEDFKEENYQKTQLIGNDLVEAGEVIYKVAGNENWSIIIAVDDKRADELVEESYVKVKFLKNQTISWGKVSISHFDENYTYVELAFNNSMSSFCTERFIDIELILDEKSGLKVPNSAIAEKEFFVIPSEFVILGGTTDSYGVLKQTYTEDGNVVPEFVEVSIYSISSSNEYYVDDSILRAGDTLIQTDSSNTFTVAKSGALIGVYNINRGYAEFKQIQVLYSNEEYSIIKSNTEYGLIPYDYIALEADSISDNDFIYN